MILRDFCEATDVEGLRACVIVLQDFESGLDPRFPDGESIVDAYIPDILRRCALYQGKIIVAEVDGEIAGYVMIWASVKAEEVEDGDFETARLADLAVLEKFRRQGIARGLIEAAEHYAREHGAEYLQIGVLAANTGAVKLYRSSGYEPFNFRVEKRL
ncbi:MAG: GNAT family N-acetyltransferase [Woeseiaceae bacterium]|nr:GNAT family N-acetyltransferase [Woeseiaceae bacterium]